MIQLDLYRKLNTSLIPIQPESKAFDMPALRQRGYDTLCDARERGTKAPDIVAWWSNNSRNTALLTTNDLIVIDFDNEARFWQYVGQYSAYTSTLTVKSPNGYHVYYRLPQPLQHRLDSDWDGAEVKCCGDAILCPPSRIGVKLYRQMGIIGKPLTLPSWEALGFLKERKSAAAQCKPFSLPSQVTEDSKHTSAPRREVGGKGLISDIKMILPLSVFLQSLGHDVVKSDNGFWLTNCPFHEDKNPSFWLNDTEGICNCFKPDCASDKPMDIINLYMRLHRCSMKQAIRELAGGVGL